MWIDYMGQCVLRLNYENMTPRRFFALCDEAIRVQEIERVNTAVEFANCYHGGKPGVTMVKQRPRVDSEAGFAGLL